MLANKERVIKMRQKRMIRDRAVIKKRDEDHRVYIGTRILSDSRDRTKTQAA